jgi:hypothetical protein
MIDEKDLKFGLCYPFFKYKIYWDILIIFILIASIILTPIDLAFTEIRQNSEDFNYFMYSIDLMFLCDLLMNFISAFEND